MNQSMGHESTMTLPARDAAFGIDEAVRREAMERLIPIFVTAPAARLAVGGRKSGSVR